SAEMVEVARAGTVDPRARFEVGDAGAAAAIVEGPFDRAISNAAFWQFPDRAAVLAALEALVEPGGLVVFNVPAERVADADAPIHPCQGELGRAIADREGAPFVPTATPFDPDAFGADAARHGLRLLDCERLEWAGPQVELM